ncbi:nucleoside phosphorylase [Streptomyces sp. 4.24]|uniref:nucleoside phosphorylase n=1 Tax=Streptomyces tritrimontium TaxID=3406573 RepID=UPI003BB53573
MNGYPLHPGKHAFPAIPDPSEHAAYVRSGDPTAHLATSDGVILLYQRRLLEHARSAYQTCARPTWVRGGLDLAEHNGRLFGVCGGFGIGAPAAALAVEQLAALGARRIITVGTAATLQPGLGPGTLVVCDRALRDEGLSHHYLPPGRSIRPSASLTEHLAEALAAAGTQSRLGPSWTTDAPYRETTVEAAQHQTAGILTADMEAAAVFAVGHHRSVDTAAVFTVADSLVDRRPREKSPAVERALRTALRAAVAALAACSVSSGTGQEY